MNHDSYARFLYVIEPINPDGIRMYHVQNLEIHKLHFERIFSTKNEY